MPQVRQQRQGLYSRLTPLTIEQVKKATETAISRGHADFVKTSTGFFTGGKNEGATYEVIQAMMDAAQGRCKIKGAGGIRDREKFLKAHRHGY